MTSKLLWAGSALAIVAFASASTADAQSRSRARPAAAAPTAPTAAAPAAPAARAPQAPPQITFNYLGTAAVPGVCVVDTGRAIENSKAGAEGQARLAQLAAPIQESMRARGEAMSKLTGEALTKERVSLELLATQRELQLSATRNKLIGRINAAVATALPTVFRQHNCSMLLKADTIVSTTEVTGPNAARASIFAPQANDITTGVSAQLDAALPNVTFELEAMPTEQEAQNALAQLRAQQRGQQ